jgi:adenosylmethionine-8-amino-7-oxononanoate aminotransferase
MRNLFTPTGRKQYIVRENAYHGEHFGPPVLCGVYANRFHDGSFVVECATFDVALADIHLITGSRA